MILAFLDQFIAVAALFIGALAINRAAEALWPHLRRFIRRRP